MFGNTGSNNDIGLTDADEPGSGSFNSGSGNIGLFNSGGNSIGFFNSGSGNFGIANSGSFNTGIGNTGNTNTVYSTSDIQHERKPGSFNTGSFNTGTASTPVALIRVIPTFESYLNVATITPASPAPATLTPGFHHRKLQQRVVLKRLPGPGRLSSRPLS